MMGVEEWLETHESVAEVFNVGGCIAALAAPMILMLIHSGFFVQLECLMLGIEFNFTAHECIIHVADNLGSTMDDVIDALALVK